MENQTNQVAGVREGPQEETRIPVSRRRLLRSLVISGGAVGGFTMLPGKWTRPVVEAGELAGHGDASPVSTSPEIDDLSFSCDWFIIIPYNCGGSVCYKDPLGQVSLETASLKFWVDFCDTDASTARSWEWDPHLEITQIKGSGSEGCLDYKLRLFSKQAEEPEGCFCVEGCFWLEVNGRKSNEICWKWEHGCD